MIKNLPMWAKVTWWLNVLVVLGLAALAVDTIMGVNSGRYDSMALLVFNYLILPIGGLIVLIWGIVFFIRRNKI